MKKFFTLTLAMLIAASLLAACTGAEGGDEVVRRRGNDGELIQTSSSGVSALAEDYDEIYAMIMELHARNSEQFYGARNGGLLLEVSEEEGSWDAGEPMGDAAAAPSAMAASDDADMYSANETAMGGGGGNAEADFSDTNNQVAGVQESDIVKTDGKNIYIANRTEGAVYVIAVNNGSMEQLAKIEQEGSNASIREMLIYDGKLITIWDNWEQIELEPAELDNQNRMYDDWYWGWGRWHWDYETIVKVYDINGSFDTPVSTYSQKGWYNSSRMLDNHIYIISNFNPPYMMQFARADIHLYIPSYSVNGSEAKFVPATSIALPEQLEYVEYTVIGGLDVNSADMSVSISASLGGTHLIYASPDNIYLTRTEYDYGDDWSWWNQYTVISRFAINSGNVNFIASGRVKGSMGSQFYMDEHNGILRAVTEVWGEVEATAENWWWGWGPHGASLYTLDENMNVLDEVHEIGFGENVQSVRFDGDIGYIVTFFIVDPLFSFDLSDPRNIVQLDELKIPGFSRYMHRWADGLLLGIGVDADEEDGMRTGLKLSMFDTSDNENLWERHVYIITDERANNNANIDWWSDDWSWSWFWTEAEWNHKAILICTEKNIIGFPYTYSFSSNTEWYNEMKYVVFSYDADGGFSLIGEIDYKDDSDGWWWGGNGFTRGLYIGDFLYVIAEDRIISAHLQTAGIVQELRFFDYQEWYEAQWGAWGWWDEPYYEDVWDEEEWDEDYITAVPLPAIEIVRTE